MAQRVPTEILDRVFAYSAPVSRNLTATTFTLEFAAELGRLSLVCQAWRIAAQRRLFSIRTISSGEDLRNCLKLARQSVLGNSFVRVLVLVLYRKDYIHSGTGVTLKPLLENLSLFHKVIELRVETHKSQDDPLLAKFVGSLEALQTLELRFTPWVREAGPVTDSYSEGTGSIQEDCGEVSEVISSDSEDGSDESHSSISSYWDWEDVRGEMTSVLKLPFPNLRTLSLFGVYWLEDANTSFSAPLLSTFSIKNTDVSEEELSWLLSSVEQPYRLFLHRLDKLPSLLDGLAELRPRLRLLSIRSEWRAPTSSGPTKDQQMEEALMSILKSCNETLRAIELEDWRIGIDQLPTLPALSDLTITLQSLRDFPQSWSASPELQTLHIRLKEAPEARNLEAEAHFSTRFALATRTVEISDVHNQHTLPSLKWYAGVPDPVIGTVSFSEVID
ncbi:hypothetical protein P389DRAFT_208191 [Cystobasidium minutum MCA 4210]|uniref:uncharacterized protein n=1 Tax=Cystobasidium minutum MCA 4210 TaxID=1397322 RepID=UPI0034CDA433|eukprot:jgi/Rhomi1/208191/estExt_Genemark1.C_1_t30218